MNKIIFIAIISFSFLIHESQAQEAIEETGSLSSGTISSQFDYLNKISNNYLEFKVVKKVDLQKIKSNVLDSLNVFEKDLIAIRQKGKEQQEKINQLESQITNTQTELEDALITKNSFSFLGTPIHKNFYNVIMWAIILGLSAALLFFFQQYSQSHKVIKTAKDDLDEMRAEFERHRKNTLERERKMKRELVDALNSKSS